MRSADQLITAREPEALEVPAPRRLGSPAGLAPPEESLALRLRPWFVCILAFYVAWMAYVSIQGLWGEVATHWPIALAMAAGSYFAGSTPMGGGTVGFPVLVLLFDLPVEIGRNFSFMVQSVGMVSASIFILASRMKVAWGLLGWAMAASLVATPLGLMYVAPYAPSLLTKLLFAVIWCSFGILHLVRIREIVEREGPGLRSRRRDMLAGLTIGALGGALLVSTTGVGVDLLLYIGAVALARMDIKIAVPTSVIVMAFNSLVGFAATYSADMLQPEVWGHWLAAAPVVALGAPGGAWAVQYLSRKKTLLICSGLLVFQYVWTCIDQRVTGLALLASVVAVGVFCGLFHVLFRLSARHA